MQRLRRNCFSVLQFGLRLRDVHRRKFNVLGIETSCDDTCAAIVSSSGKILSENVSSQFSIHAPYGGVFPFLASRAHEENIERITNDTIKRSRLSDTMEGMKDHISAVAVTSGPGLQPCLGTGIRMAKKLCTQWKVPLIGIHHLEAHALVIRLPGIIRENMNIELPFLLLLISGGHTQLIECKESGEYEILGSSLDDAVGEAFDKTARLLEIEPHPDYHRGEQLEQLAEKGNPGSIQLTRPLSKQKKSCNFSYSGLKTQVRRRLELQGNDVSPQFKADLAAAFQATATQHLVRQTSHALTTTNLRTLVVAGGVARNKHIRKTIESLKLLHSVDIVFPPPKYCTDNAVMTAWAGIEKMKRNPNFTDDFDIVHPEPRWKISQPIKPLEH